MNNLAPLPMPETRPEKSRPSILVIDDDPVAIGLIDNALKHDYDVRVALGGEKGLDILAAAPLPDLILLDVVMPYMDGYKVCEMIRHQPATQQIPVIFLTSLTDEFSTVKAFELGANDFVGKPICPRVLGVRVQAQLTLSNHQRELENKVRVRTREICDLQLNIIQCLGRAAEFRDNETGFHVIRMSQYAQRLALAAGVDRATAEMLLHAAPMHDVGKIGIPDHILLKTGPLSAAEFDVIRQHPLIGAEILGRYESDLMHMARQVAITHHEKWDGSGYPHGLAGENIPLVGRIVAIADVFDALTSVRPYKPAWPVEQAIDYLQSQKNLHFDGRLIDCFIAALPKILEIKKKYVEVEVSGQEDRGLSHGSENA
jgi:putative two-component system response regulator